VLLYSGVVDIIDIIFGSGFGVKNLIKISFLLARSIARVYLSADKFLYNSRVQMVARCSFRRLMLGQLTQLVALRLLIQFTYMHEREKENLTIIPPSWQNKYFVLLDKRMQHSPFLRKKRNW
jgi:hypothetical protein